MSVSIRTAGAVGSKLLGQGWGASKQRDCLLEVAPARQVPGLTPLLASDTGFAALTPDSSFVNIDYNNENE